jgi:hypothetical protein
MTLNTDTGEPFPQIAANRNSSNLERQSGCRICIVLIKLVHDLRHNRFVSSLIPGVGSGGSAGSFCIDELQRAMHGLPRLRLREAETSQRASRLACTVNMYDTDHMCTMRGLYEKDDAAGFRSGPQKLSSIKIYTDRRYDTPWSSANDNTSILSLLELPT